jgi:hypothetical protein
MAQDTAIHIIMSQLCSQRAALKVREWMLSLVGWAGLVGPRVVRLAYD